MELSLSSIQLTNIWAHRSGLEIIWAASGHVIGLTLGQGDWSRYFQLRARNLQYKRNYMKLLEEILELIL